MSAIAINDQFLNYLKNSDHDLDLKEILDFTFWRGKADSSSGKFFAKFKSEEKHIEKRLDQCLAILERDNQNRFQVDQGLIEIREISADQEPLNKAQRERVVAATLTLLKFSRGNDKGQPTLKKDQLFALELSRPKELEANSPLQSLTLDELKARLKWNETRLVDVPVRFRSDLDVVRICVEKNGLDLKDASEEARESWDINVIALTANPEALRFCLNKKAVEHHVRWRKIQDPALLASCFQHDRAILEIIEANKEWTLRQT